MNYAFEHEGKVFTPDGKIELSSAEVEAHNAQVEAAELAAWQTKPEWFAVYVVGNAATGRSVTTWSGVVLGTITRANTYRGNIARNMTSIRFRGTNGVEYYGRYGSDWSQLCRVRKAKESPLQYCVNIGGNRNRWFPDEAQARAFASAVFERTGIAVSIVRERRRARITEIEASGLTSPLAPPLDSFRAALLTL